MQTLPQKSVRMRTRPLLLPHASASVRSWHRRWSWNANASTPRRRWLNSDDAQRKLLLRRQRWRHRRQQLHRRLQLPVHLLERMEQMLLVPRMFPLRLSLLRPLPPHLLSRCQHPARSPLSFLRRRRPVLRCARSRL